MFDVDGSSFSPAIFIVQAFHIIWNIGVIGTIEEGFGDEDNADRLLPQKLLQLPLLVLQAIGISGIIFRELKSVNLNTAPFLLSHLHRLCQLGYAFLHV